MAAPRRRMAPGHVRRYIRLPSTESRVGGLHCSPGDDVGLSIVRRREPGGNAVLWSLRRAHEPGLQPEVADEQNVTDALRSFVTSAVADRLVEAGGQLPEERRLITRSSPTSQGFTCSRSASTRSSSSRSSILVISGLSTIVGRYEGYVEKFAGDALLRAGAPISHEDDAERASLVALEMHEGFRADVRAATARSRAQRPHRGQLGSRDRPRAGKGGMDYAVLGDSVILAQRLESAAPRGRRT